jgi:thioredoxin-like negative regulator of GroEL
MSDQNSNIGPREMHVLADQTVRELMSDGEYAKAATLLRQRLTESASDHERRLMAACLFELADYEGALAQLAQLKQQRPDDALSRGWLQHQQDYLDRAKAAAMDPRPQILAINA